MKKFLLLTITAFSLFSTKCEAQWWTAREGVNVPLLHQLVSNNKIENEKQVNVKKEQAKSTGIEDLNRENLKIVKNKYRTLQQRFAKMSIVFDAANIGLSAEPLVKEIIKQQKKIVSNVSKDPSLIPVAIDTEILFVKKANSLINYLIGLCAVVGDLNQMKVSDRRILFQYVLDELREINYMSENVSRSLNAFIVKSNVVDQFSNYTKRENILVDEIMNNARILKK